MTILVPMIFYRQSTIIPILHYSMINLKEAAFLIRFGLIDLMIISAEKRRFHCCKIHFLKSFSMEMNTERDYQDL